MDWAGANGASPAVFQRVAAAGAGVEPAPREGCTCFVFLSVSRSSKNVLLDFSFYDKLCELNKFSGINYFWVRISQIVSSFTSRRIGSQVITVIFEIFHVVTFFYVSVQTFFPSLFPYCCPGKNLHPHLVLSL